MTQAIKRMVGVVFWVVRQRKKEGVIWRDFYLGLGIVGLAVLILAALAVLGASQLL